MAKIKSRITSKPPKMVKAPYIGSYVEGQATMGKVYNPSLRKYYGDSGQRTSERQLMS